MKKSIGQRLGSLHELLIGRSECELDVHLKKWGVNDWRSLMFYWKIEVLHFDKTFK